MLCPVCKANPLRGRQATCSTKCRSARYREKKQQQRDTSQHAVRTSATHRRSLNQQQRSSDFKRWEELVSSAVDRIREAIERQGDGAAQQARAALRVDLREQVSTQAPTSATGYRLVLPGRYAGDPPRLSPKRSRDQNVAWYSLTPFEYPDDVRLCDGFWYRIVWVDARGRRIRLQPGESVPGLYYFVGPAQSRAAGPQIEQRAVAPALPPLPQDSASDSAHAKSLDDLGELVNTLAAQILSEEKRTKYDTRMVASDAVKEKPSLLATLPPQLIAGTTEDDRDAIATLPPLTLADSTQVVRFVQQPEWMLQLLYEERFAGACAKGLPMPAEPPTSLSHHDRKTIHELLTNRVAAPFVLLCKLLHAYARKYGTEALDFLPTPLPPVPEAEQQRLQNAILNTQKRMYLDYVHTRQESLLRSLPLPEEPVTSLSSKERSQLRRMMRDTRMVILFERQVHPPLAFIRS